MNIIVCDDSSVDRVALTELLREYEQQNGVSFAITEFDSGEALCADEEALKQAQLIFLDINMSAMDGLKTTTEIKKKYPDIPVVLVTAYMNYVLDGYKVKARYFLPKDNLADTLSECLNDLIEEIDRNSLRLEFSFVEGTVKLAVDEIIYIETARHKNIFYTTKGEFSIYKKMDELESELDKYGFVRVHLSFLINMRYIAKLGSYLLTLTNGKEISVPKSRYPEAKRKYMLFKGED